MWFYSDLDMWLTYGKYNCHYIYIYAVIFTFVVTIQITVRFGTWSVDKVGINFKRQHHNK